MPKRVPLNPLFKRMRGRWCVARNWRGKRALFKIAHASAREGRTCLSDASHQVFLARLSVGKGAGKFKRGEYIIMGGLLLGFSPPILFQGTESLAGIGRSPLNLEAWDPPAARVLRAWRESRFTPRTQQARLGDLPRDIIESIAVHTAVACQDETGDITENDQCDSECDSDSGLFR